MCTVRGISNYPGEIDSGERSPLLHLTIGGTECKPTNSLQYQAVFLLFSTHLESVNLAASSVDYPHASRAKEGSNQGHHQHHNCPRSGVQYIAAKAISLASTASYFRPCRYQLKIHPGFRPWLMTSFPLPSLLLLNLGPPRLRAAADTTVSELQFLRSHGSRTKSVGLPLLIRLSIDFSK